MQKVEKNKFLIARDHILDGIETGKFVVGKRLPGAKKLSSTINVSYVVVKAVIDSLTGEGILYSVPRGGSYVSELWRERILHTNLVSDLLNRSWFDSLNKTLEDYVPEVRLTTAFKRGIFQINASHYVQAHHDEFLDLQPLLDECFPDQSDLNLEPFKSFYFNNKLAGIPFIYSPRVMFYNQRVLRENGCTEPYPGWSWSEFIASIKLLRNKLQPQQIIDWRPRPFFWINIVARSGGSIIDPGFADSVRIDSEETIAGLERTRELGQLINRFQSSHLKRYDFFTHKDTAFHIGGLGQLFNSNTDNDIRIVPLPLIEGGVDTTMQSSELLNINKNCNNLNNARKLIKIFLSEDFQDILAQKRIGLPVRKSSTRKYFDSSNKADSIFLLEAAKVKRAYNLDNPMLFDIVSKGIEQCLMSDDKMTPKLRLLAATVRTFLSINNDSWNQTINSTMEALNA